MAPTFQGKYHGCWWPRSLRRQVISNVDIKHVEEALELSVPFQFSEMLNMETLKG